MEDLSDPCRRKVLCHVHSFVPYAPSWLQTVIRSIRSLSNKCDSYFKNQEIKINHRNWHYEHFCDDAVETFVEWRVTRRTSSMDWAEEIVTHATEPTVPNLSANFWRWLDLSGGYSSNRRDTFNLPATDTLILCDERFIVKWKEKNLTKLIHHFILLFIFLHDFWSNVCHYYVVWRKCIQDRKLWDLKGEIMNHSWAGHVSLGRSTESPFARYFHILIKKGKNLRSQCEIRTINGIVSIL